MPDVTFGPQATDVRLSYRPREAPDDGTGWASEAIALLLRNGEWARLSLSALGIPTELWPGADPMAGVPASSGVVMVDLGSGGFRHYLGDSGWVGEVRWHPGGERFTADVMSRGRDAVVDVTSGSVGPAAGARWASSPSPNRSRSP